MCPNHRESNLESGLILCKISFNEIKISLKKRRFRKYSLQQMLSFIQEWPKSFLQQTDCCSFFYISVCFACDKTTVQAPSYWSASFLFYLTNIRMEKVESWFPNHWSVRWFFFFTFCFASINLKTFQSPIKCTI